jgi:hypothetical protein
VGVDGQLAEHLLLRKMPSGCCSTFDTAVHAVFIFTSGKSASLRLLPALRASWRVLAPSWQFLATGGARYTLLPRLLQLVAASIECQLPDHESLYHCIYCIFPWFQVAASVEGQLAGACAKLAAMEAAREQQEGEADSIRDKIRSLLIRRWGHAAPPKRFD